MLTWLKFLFLEIQDFDIENLIEPTEEVGEGETIAGVVSDELKKLWSLHRAAKKSAEMMEVELKFSKPSTQERGRVLELKTKARGLEMIFWILALDELGLWGHPEQNALRIGWQVVKFKPIEFTFPFKMFGIQE